ncbi:MAG TPA: DUF3465 domain-containing protein [Candidatus Dormibacteraeota bacterium]|nr:DUF3465 domain-containing protein [Candidatus Dormibacteraeota bacterium]
MKLASLVAAMLLLLAACGGRDVPDDQGLHRAIANDASGTEVTFNATVLSNPVESGGHERFEVKAPTGETLEIDHNTTLAQSVPLRSGDQVIIHGQLYIDPGPHVGVHCTHAATSGGCPYPGWIEFANNYYE